MDQLSRIALAQRKIEAAESILWNFVADKDIVLAMRHLADASRNLASLKKELEWHREPTQGRRSKFKTMKEAIENYDSPKDVT